MTHYQYPQQSRTERAQLGTPVVQSPQPTSFSQPVAKPQVTGQLAQQPPFSGATVQAGTAQPSQQGAAEYTRQPTPPAQKAASPQSQHLQLEGPSAQRQPQVQPVAQQTQPVTPQVVQPQQVTAPSTQELAQPAVSTQQQLPARAEWAKQPTAQSVQSVPAQQTGAVQAAGSQAASGAQTGSGGQAAGQAQPTGFEQTMSAMPESQFEQQAETSPAKGIPNVGIYETTDELVVFADVPGVNSEDIELVGNENSVTLVANRGEPSVTDGKVIQRECAEELERTIPLPARAEIDEAEATVEDGVVRITLPKNEDVREKRIGIQ
ncbi:MAG: Hsp20 family protein [Halolamina sp.]